MRQRQSSLHIRLLLLQQPSARLFASCTLSLTWQRTLRPRLSLWPPCLQQLDDLEDQEGLSHMYQIMKGAIMLADTSESGLCGVLELPFSMNKLGSGPSRLRRRWSCVAGEA